MFFSRFVFPITDNWISIMSDLTTALPELASAYLDKHSNNHPFTIRPYVQDDLEWVECLHALAFGPGRFARTAFRVREMFAVDPGLCLIAEHEGVRVGVVWMTPISLNGINGHLLGPLASDPEYRNRGIGRMLVRAVTGLALNQQNSGFVLLFGDARYFARLGFELVSGNSIVFPGPVDCARILVSCGSDTHVDRLVGKLCAPVV
jgi:predicted N-acetyltransferase YhbS